MHFEATKKGKVIIVRGLESLNSGATAEIMGHLEEAGVTGGTLLQLDLGGAEAVSASGVVGLLKIYEYMSKHSCRVEISVINKSLASVFRLLRLTRFFDIREKGTGGLQPK